MRVYLACSFAYEDKELTKSRKEVMEQVQTYIEDLGYDVYNPSKLKIENAWDYTMQEWGKLVFEEDIRELNKADVVVFLSFGKENNAGSAWECGYAYALKKTIVMISMNPDSPESLMCVNSATACLKGMAGLEKYDMYDLEPVNEFTGVES